MIDLKSYKFNELPTSKVEFNDDFVEIRALTTRELVELSKIADEDGISQAIFCLERGCGIDKKIAEKIIDVDFGNATKIVEKIISLSNEFHSSIKETIAQKKI